MDDAEELEDFKSPLQFLVEVGIWCAVGLDLMWSGRPEILGVFDESWDVPSEGTGEEREMRLKASMAAIAGWCWLEEQLVWLVVNQSWWGWYASIEIGKKLKKSYDLMMLLLSRLRVGEYIRMEAAEDSQWWQDEEIERTEGGGGEVRRRRMVDWRLLMVMSGIDVGVDSEVVIFCDKSNSLNFLFFFTNLFS